MLRGLGARLTPVEAPFDPEHGLRHGARSVRTDAHRPVTRSEPTSREQARSALEPEARTSIRRSALDAALYRLMAWLSPAYPIGAFSYSSGIEWAVEAGDITDAATLERWLAVMIADGGGFCDAVFFVHAYRAVADGDDAALRAVAELAAAFAPSKERHLETTAQGRAFLDTTRAAWPCAALDRLLAVWDGAVALPVAVGVACAGPWRCRSAPALHAYLHALAANLISAGVRLVPLGQTDGQRVLAALEPVVAATAERALGDRARRGRQRRVPRRSRQHAPRDPVHAAVQELSMQTSARSAARRRRRPGRLRQDRADGRLVQGAARALRDRRDHQRHLHQVGRRISGALRRARARAHRRRRDRRLSAHRDPRGRLDQSRGGRRHAARSFRRSIWC